MDETPAAPRHRWFRFSLRTLLLLVVVIAMPLGYAARQLSILDQRRRVLETLAWPRASVQLSDNMHGPTVDAPWPLPFLGSGYGVVYFELRPGEFTAAERAKIEWLFPEAMVVSDPAYFDWIERLSRQQPGESRPEEPRLEVFEYARRLQLGE